MDRRSFLARSSLLTAGGLLAGDLTADATPAKWQVGAYYFPGFHFDPRIEPHHGKGWTEWELLKRGEPRFAGHQQPKKPLWGYADEADPQVFARKIDAAADHGLNHFIFDWYWYEGQPFLHRPLENGFLNAGNNNRLRFSLMWANHDWMDLHPAKLAGTPNTLFRGGVTRDVFENMTDYIVAKYFKHPSYWTIDGAPYFSLYQLFTLVEGLGGVNPTKAALDSFRTKTRRAGFADLHLNAVTWGVKILPSEHQIENVSQLLAALGFNSTASYVWIHHVEMPDFPTTEYDYVARKGGEYWRRASGETGLPYHPNVTMGWDPSPRTCQSDVYVSKGYPFTPILRGNTPAAFKEALKAAKGFLESEAPGNRILNINAWNEWTEGSYLEPDTINELAYLEAIHEVFGDGKSK